MKQPKLLSILWVMLLVVSCKTETKEAKDISLDYEFKKDTLLEFIQDQDTLNQVFEIELATTDYEKETGLMHRKEMKANQGMLFVYETQAARPGFYMKNTHIALDLIYIDKDLNIVDFNLNAIPFSEELIPSKVPSLYVLEVKAGSVKELNLKKGDQIHLN